LKHYNNKYLAVTSHCSSVHDYGTQHWSTTSKATSSQSGWYAW